MRLARTLRFTGVWIAALTVFSGLRSAAFFQDPQTPEAFDVVAIHAARAVGSRDEHITSSPRNGSLHAENVPLLSLMEVAYGLPDLRMFGGPAWTRSERFDVDAKSDPALGARLAAMPVEDARAVKRRMLAALLAERFALRVHPEARVLPVYQMVVKDAAQLTRATPCAGVGDDRIAARPGRDSLAILAYELSWRLGRPVIDRTGVSFHGELALCFTRGNGDGPSVFTALEEQLGLKLVSGRESVPVLVIDHAEEPRGN